MSAKRSHPPTLLRVVERTLREERLVEGATTILCACSGGPDSTALLHALCRLREVHRCALFAVGVDHGLRAEAASELSFARRVAEAHRVPFEVVALGVRPGGNLQARARAARFEALEARAAELPACVIATGHTRDDRAETVLMRLLRGAGPRGLAALPPRDGLRVRPLIRVARADVRLHLERHRIDSADDPTNRDSRFLRARVRHELLPLLRELSPNVVAHLTGLADALGDQGPGDEALEGLGRAQREAIRRARAQGRREVRLRVAGGRELVARIANDGSVLIEGKS